MSGKAVAHMENFLDAAAVEIWTFQDRRDLAKVFIWTVGKCFRMRHGPVGHEWSLQQGSCETSAGPGPSSHPRLADPPPPAPLPFTWIEALLVCVTVALFVFRFTRAPLYSRTSRFRSTSCCSCVLPGFWLRCHHSVHKQSCLHECSNLSNLMFDTSFDPDNPNSPHYPLQMSGGTPCLHSHRWASRWAGPCPGFTRSGSVPTRSCYHQCISGWVQPDGEVGYCSLFQKPQWKDAV